MKNFIVYIALVLLLFACKPSTKIEATEPLGKTQKFNNELPTSTLVLPIQLDIHELSKNLNTQLKTELYNDNDFDNNGGDNIKVKITRKADLKISAKNDSLFSELPLQIELAGRYIPPISFLSSMAVEKDLTLNLVAIANVKIIPQNNWSLKTQSKISYRWIENPVLEIGLLKIPIKRIIEPIMDKELAKYSQQFDQEITSKLNLKSEMERFWNEIQIPQLIDSKTHTWLIIQPEKLTLAPITSSQQFIHLNAALQGKIKVISDSLHKKILNKSALPNLEIEKPKSENFNFTIVGEIPYTKINDLLNQNLANQNYVLENGKHEISFSSFEVNALGDLIKIKTDLKGKSKGKLFSKKYVGTVYLTGKLYIEPETQMLGIKNLKFDLKSKDALLKTAEWMLKSNIEKKIEGQKISLKKEMDNYKNLANQQLKNFEVNDQFNLKASVQKLEIIEIMPQENELQIWLEAQGKANGIFKIK